MADIIKLKALLDTYGVGVRAGVITPQTADETYFRKIMDLPEMSPEVAAQWQSEGGIRKPITLAQEGGGSSSNQQVTE